MKYRYIQQQAGGRWSVSMMCRALGVSRSGLHECCNRRPSRRSQEDRVLLEHIQLIHQRSRESAGAHKTWRALQAQGHCYGRDRVARVRRTNGIEAKRMRRFRSGTAGRTSESASPNLLQRCFEMERPNQAWVGDATFIPTRQGWLFLAVMLDLYSRTVVGWAMGTQLNRQLVLAALQMAIEQRRPEAGLVHHTDQGSVYAAAEYREVLQQHQMLPSMSRKGNCHDNAVAESFFSTLKNELTWHCDFATREEARSAVFDFIELFYNRHRLHQTLGYVSPAEYEQRIGS